MRRKKFTLRKTKNRETRVIPMPPDVHAAFSELWKDRRLDTNRVFLYKGKPWKNPGLPLQRLVEGLEFRGYVSMIFATRLARI